MNTRKLLLPVFAALFGLAVSAFGQTQTTEATVAKVTGAATVTLPDGSTTPLTVGMKVPQGATITTGADGDVYIESHAGYVTSIKHDSVVAMDEISVTYTGGKVTEEKTLLNLKSGNLVAKLDPSKKAVNNYQVRTPKGVAAARGTTFTVSYKGNNYTLAVVEGVVRVTATSGTYGTGGDFVEMGAGRLLSNTSTNLDASGTQVGDWNQSSVLGGSSLQAELRELLAVTVATVAVAAEKGIGGTTAAELREVADAVIKADPSAAPTIAALVASSAPTQSQAVIASTAANAPDQSAAVQTAVTNSTPSTTTNPTTGTTTTTPSTTAPQPIDPSTVSRSNE